MFAPWQFRFLNHTHTLAISGGWNDGELEKLWLYNLHYFDDLIALGARDRVEWHRNLIVRWLLENPPTSGNGWESYPTSLRIVNWIKWLAAGNTPVLGMLESLSLQAAWLRKRIEWHLLGNHLFANAKALIFAGLIFEGNQAADWRLKGLQIVTDELSEQVLLDGGNFELTPMYHAIFLDDVLDLVNAATHWTGIIPDAQIFILSETAERMLIWLTGMTHPDGQIGFFNDTALGVAACAKQLQAYARSVGIFAYPQVTHTHLNSLGANSPPRVWHMANSGYVRLETDTAVALLDTAKIGPDYLPGHAHADTLSFELSVFGQRVVVNGGTSCYGSGLDRQRERGTAAHSTVLVAGENSSDVWSGFRVARRAYPFDLRVDQNADHANVKCSHSGYKHLHGSPVHERNWYIDARCMRVVDRVQGGMHKAQARYIFHPSLRVTNISNSIWQLDLVGGQSLRLIVLIGLGSIENAKYSPEFGLVLSTQCLAIELVDGQAQLELLWS